MTAAPPKVFHKLIETNPNITYAIGTIIAEYDIKRAHPSCMYFIKGKEFYDKLISMPKLDSNILIGKMIREDPTLSDKIGQIKLKYFNEFCKVNNIKDSNFISSTVDSMLLVNKKPLKTQFENGVINFRNKDGEYTSYVRLSYGREIEMLYDGMSNDIKIKGINADYVNGNTPLIRLIKQAFMLLESTNKMQTSEILKKTNYLRNKYINSKDPLMWANIFEGNKYVYDINGERVVLDEPVKEDESTIMVKSDNFVFMLLPLIKLCFKPH